MASTRSRGPRRPSLASTTATCPDWRRNSASLRYAVGIPLEAIAGAHQEAKRDLLAEVNARTNAGLDQDVFTLGFARRATPYKRPTLLFHDPQRLRRLARLPGLQIVLAGKAHPRDEAGKDLIQRMIRSAPASGPRSRSSTSTTTMFAWPSARHRRRGRLGQYPQAALGGIGDERHEGRPQRRAQPQRARRLVVGRAHRGCHWLGDRLARARSQPRSQRRCRCRRSLPGAGAGHPAALLRRSWPLDRDHALDDRPQRVVLQRQRMLQEYVAQAYSESG